ncbi:Embryo-specific protein ATS3B [Glycine soja]
MKALILILTLCSFSQAATSIVSQPQPKESFKLNQTKPQNDEASSSCSYTVSIKTSCSSPPYTRDYISLAFGDAYGYQVYVPRLDGPRSGTFERCSTDTFEIYGPCTYQTCYLYLYRTGYDGWMPEKVTVYSYYYQPVTFYYNTYIPNAIWYGFDYCNGYLPSTSTTTAPHRYHVICNSTLVRYHVVKPNSFISSFNWWILDEKLLDWGRLPFISHMVKVYSFHMLALGPVHFIGDKFQVPSSKFHVCPPCILQGVMHDYESGSRLQYGIFLFSLSIEGYGMIFVAACVESWNLQPCRKHKSRNKS